MESEGTGWHQGTTFGQKREKESYETRKHRPTDGRLGGRRTQTKLGGGGKDPRKM